MRPESRGTKQAPGEGGPDQHVPSIQRVSHSQIPHVGKRRRVVTSSDIPRKQAPAEAKVTIGPRAQFPYEAQL